MPSTETIGYGPYLNAGAPVAGTDAVQTLTIGGTPTEEAGSGFYLGFEGRRTALALWSATNATLVAAIDAALEAVLGTGAVVTAVGTAVAGIGTITITFAGANYAKRVQPLITVVKNVMTGTAPTITVEETTPGVDATALGAPKGAKLIDTTNGIDYINTGTAAAPTWTKVGLQT